MQAPSSRREQQEIGGVPMLDARRLDLLADTLENEIRYRDLLRAELARMEAHLAVAAELAAAGRRRELSSWLLTADGETVRPH